MATQQQRPTPIERRGKIEQLGAPRAARTAAEAGRRCHGGAGCSTAVSCCRRQPTRYICLQRARMITVAEFRLYSLDLEGTALRGSLLKSQTQAGNRLLVNDVLCGPILATC